MNKFCKPGGNVVAFCVEIGATAKGRFIAPGRFMLDARDVSGASIAQCNLSVSKVFAEQALSDDQVMQKSEQIQAATEHNLRRSATGVENRQEKIW